MYFCRAFSSFFLEHQPESPTGYSDMQVTIKCWVVYRRIYVCILQIMSLALLCPMKIFYRHDTDSSFIIFYCNVWVFRFMRFQILILDVQIVIDQTFFFYIYIIYYSLNQFNNNFFIQNYLNLYIHSITFYIIWYIRVYICIKIIWPNIYYIQNDTYKACPFIF